MHETGNISLLCAYLISAYNAPSPPTYKKKKKRGRKSLIPGKNDLFLGHKHRVMTDPRPKEMEESGKAFCVTIVYETV